MEPAVQFSEDELSRLQKCEEIVGYQFQNKQLLCAALTHASGAQHRLASNERLEFLGDAILEYIITEHMNMNKSKKQLLTSILTDSGLYSYMPVYGRMSFIQWPAKKYASLSSAQEAHADEEEDMGYESSWSEIFRSTRG